MLPTYVSLRMIELSFGTIDVLSRSLAEVIVDEGVQIDLAEVEEFHQALTNNFEGPIGALINKINAYTYSFEAQLKISDLPQLKASAVLVYSKRTLSATTALQDMPPNRKLNIKNFWDRNEALAWLSKEVEAAS